ncbi:MAG TPA: lipopolysaccharide biosynthesis protein [Sphingobacteriaceae bacterium]|nr:lipopolysaccharide biosynthesis protein [Sphingobacteriaceae bacterium]
MEISNQHLVNENIGQSQGSGTKDYNEISLREIILKAHKWQKYFFSKWKFILIVCTLGGVLGIIYSYTKKALYIAELTFVLEEGEAGGGNAYSGIASQLGIDLGGNSAGGIFVGENLFAFMKSRSMIQKTLMTPVDFKGRKITLAEFYIEINGLRDAWEKNPKLKDIQFLPGTDPSAFSLYQNSIMNGFHKSIVANNLFVDRQDKKSNLLSIRVTSTNELFSKYFTETLAKEVSDLYIETKTKKSATTVSILQHQTDSIKRALDFGIRGVAASTDANPNQNPARQILKVESQRKQIDVQVGQTIFNQLVQNLEVAKMSLRKETPLIQIIDHPVLPLDMIVFGKVKGFIFGFILAGFLVICYLLINKVYKDYKLN